MLSLAAFASRHLPLPIIRLFYRSQLIARSIRRFLNWAVPDGLTEVSVAAGAIAGYRLHLDLRTEKDYWLGTYEPELQAAICDWVKPGMIAYDVGGNIGYVTLMLSRAVSEEGKVYVFEPLPRNLERLQDTLTLNGLETKVRVIPNAVTNVTKPVRFYCGPSDGMGKVEGSAGREIPTYGEILVHGVSLDDFVYGHGNPAPQVIKMDIEGGEVLALQGMRLLLQQARPVLLLELHGPQAAQVAWHILTDAYYSLCWMRHSYPPIQDVACLRWKAYIIGIPASIPHPGKTP